MSEALSPEQPAKKSRGTGASPEQMELFRSIVGVYLTGDAVDNDDLYANLVERGAVDPATLDRQEPIGERGARCSTVKRQVRWHQQTLKHLGILERIPSRRGTWRATDKAKAELTPAPPKVSLVGFSASRSGVRATCSSASTSRSCWR